jgi:gliding motility-associated lipoprotein GldD
MKFFFIPLLFISAIIAASCSSDEYSQPKPKTYVRIEIPQPKYLTFDTSSLPFAFQYPDYGKLVPNTFEANGNWFNLNFEKYGYVLYLTYIPVTSAGYLDTLISDCERLAYEGQNKRSSGVISRSYVNEDERIYATTYHIKGTRVASPEQFFVTDKKKHFLRASLSFTQKPNNDSLAPIIERLNADLENLIGTLRWKN